jgi:hypothetical protein
MLLCVLLGANWGCRLCHQEIQSLNFLAFGLVQSPEKFDIDKIKN